MELSKIPNPGENYYHFKHNSNLDSLNYCYVIIGIGKHTETGEKVVIYKPLYECDVEFFVRPLGMFFEVVDKPEFEYNGPRFRLVKRIVENAESQKITLDTYNNHVQKYVELTKSIGDNPDAKSWLEFLSTLIDKDVSILEIGSGSGVCADYLESLGFTIVRTDAVESFIDYQKSLGKSIRFLNILTNTASQKYDFILANAVLHHFNSSELEIVLNNVKESLSDDGLFAFSVNIGDGEEFTNQKMDAPRYYKYWKKETIDPMLSTFGFAIIDSQETGRWLRMVVKKI
jgi:2-polyprenyl-3-methyl-5-hydroxy-6-metoxy-1,4-benzoquinol methylase